MTSLPPPIPPIKVEVLTTPPPQLNKKEVKLLTEIKRKEVNLGRIVEANNKKMKADSESELPSAFFSPPDRKPFLKFQFDINTAVEPTTILFEGMYVEVSGDSSPNMNRPWGCGFITGPVRHIGADSFVDVKYTVAYDGGRLHKNIHVMDDITIASYHQDMLMGVPQRAASLNQSRVEEEHEIAGDGRIKTEILIDLLKSGTRGRKGWHRRDLQLNPKLIKDAKTKPQLNSAEKAQLMFEVEMLRAYQKWNGGNRHLLRNRQKKFKKRVTKHDPTSITYLTEEAWGLGSGSAYVRRLEKVIRKSAATNGIDAKTANVMIVSLDDTKDSGITTVIDDYGLAETRYTAQYLYAIHRCRQQAVDNLDGIGMATYQARMKIARDAYDNMGDREKAPWIFKRREHLKLQPTIDGRLKEELRKNSSILYHQLETKILHWCSSLTIRRWVQSREGYKLFTERIIPLMNDEQKFKHLHFARHFRSNWDLGAGKYLLVHYDEKWFWGLVMRKNGKTFEDLDNTTIRAYHKSHISKVMAIAVTGFGFEDNIENGGEAVNIAFTRCQSHKVAGRMQRASRKDENGKTKYDGAIVREKDQMYLVDCAVTGSNIGTADSPKFPLMSYFEETVFPRIIALVGPGGKFENYTVVIQGDNAGPHEDKVYKRYVEEYCGREGWHWEPQAPQMPHMNVLDLSVFPNMSKRHSSLARDHNGMHMLKEDQIWDTAELVWNDLPSCKIASGYVQANRIASKVIHHRGDNIFLSGSNGGISTGVSKDFDESREGLTRKDGQVFIAATA